MPPPAPSKNAKDAKNPKEAAMTTSPASAGMKATTVSGAGSASPPLNVSALRDEIGRSSGVDARTQIKKDRERLEQLVAEINKAREALRQDTARLETVLARKDPVAAAAADAGGAGGVGEGGKKIPTSLEGLAKAMRGMKPEQAAPIVSRLERKLAADVLMKMPAVDAGKVMGQLKPDIAAELATEIASRTPRAELRR
jgi:flagellar motility protein MotE (MotC chaperone)